MTEPGVQLALLPEVAPLIVSREVFCCFELPGEPIAKARPRARMVFPRGKPAFIQFYETAQGQQYEQALGYAARAAMRGREPTTRPIAVLLHAFLQVPISWSARRRSDALAGVTRPASKPDADNFLKVIDGLNGVVWVDDAQVIDARIVKKFSARPALRIETREFVSPK